MTTLRRKIPLACGDSLDLQLQHMCRATSGKNTAISARRRGHLRLQTGKNKVANCSSAKMVACAGFAPANPSARSNQRFATTWVRNCHLKARETPLPAIRRSTQFRATSVLQPCHWSPASQKSRFALGMDARLANHTCRTLSSRCGGNADACTCTHCSCVPAQ